MLLTNVGYVAARKLFILDITLYIRNGSKWLRMACELLVGEAGAARLIMRMEMVVMRPINNLKECNPLCPTPR